MSPTGNSPGANGGSPDDSSELNGLDSESGNEHQEQEEPRGEDSGGRSDDNDDPVIEPEIVEPESEAPGVANRSLAERGPRDAVGHEQPRRPRPSFSFQAGPLPSVEQLEGYRNLDSSFPERLLRMAEASTTDASRREDRALAAEISERKRGQYAAFTLAFAGFIAAVVFGALGHYVIASILISVPFVLLVRALIGDAGKRGGHGDDSDTPPTDSGS